MGRIRPGKAAATKAGMAKQRQPAKKGRARVNERWRNGIVDRLQEIRGPDRSRAKFAKDLGVSHATMRGWVSAERKAPDLPHILQLCDDLSISPSWLLLGRGPKYLDELDGTSGNTIEEFRVRLLAELTSEVSAKRKAEMAGDLPPTGEFFESTKEIWNSRLFSIANERRELQLQGFRSWIRKQKTGEIATRQDLYAAIERAIEDGSDVIHGTVPEVLLGKPIRSLDEPSSNALFVLDEGNGILRLQLPRK
jgi:transcriptional regulator with XRE-family HTH domain